MSQQFKPTRSELIALKRRIKMAEMGYKILKKKRDGLILSFFEILKKAKNARAELNELYKGAVYKMNVTRMLEGDLKLKALALAISQSPSLEITQTSVMGVVVPNVRAMEKIEKGARERGYGTLGLSLAVDEAVASYEKVVEKTIEVAEIENGMKRLLEEIDKTKRRVNALEYEIIPRLTKAKNFISMRLEEMERETVFRTKRIKKKNKSR